MGWAQGPDVLGRRSIPDRVGASGCGVGDREGLVTFDDKNAMCVPGSADFKPDALAANQRIFDPMAHIARRENATQFRLLWRG